MRPWNRKDLRGHRPAYIPPHCRPCADHTGREFPSQLAMCAAWGISPGRFRSLKLKGLPLDQILTARPYHRGKICKDHTGREFPSIQAMCDFWHINISTYHNRRRDGMSLRQILTAPVKGRNA